MVRGCRASILRSRSRGRSAAPKFAPPGRSGIGLALRGKATAETGLSLSEFGLYSGGTDIAQGAFVLFLTNLIGIIGVAVLVFASQRYGEWKKALLALMLILGLSAFLVPPLQQ